MWKMSFPEITNAGFPSDWDRCPTLQKWFEINTFLRWRQLIEQEFPTLNGQWNATCFLLQAGNHAVAIL